MTEKKREQVEADLRTIIKGSKKSIFVYIFILYKENFKRVKKT